MNRANVGMPLHVSAKQMLRSDLDASLKAKQMTVRISHHCAKPAIFKPHRIREDGAGILSAKLF